MHSNVNVYKYTDEYKLDYFTCSRSQIFVDGVVATGQIV